MATNPSVMHYVAPLVFKCLRLVKVPRGNNPASGMRFRGGAGPTFLINGEPVQGGPRGGMSVIDTITTDMIERIEVVKQPSVAQASVQFLLRSLILF